MEQFIPVELYGFIYLGLITILVFVFTNYYRFSKDYESKDQGLINALILGVFFILYFGLRPTHGTAMTDTQNYVGSYEVIKAGITRYEINWREGKELIWCLIMNTMGGDLKWPVSLWLTFVASIYIMFNIWGIRRILPNHIYPALLFYIAFFLFYSGGINGIRNADAYSIVFFGITLCTNPTTRNYILMAILFFIGYQIHSSVMATIGAFILARFVVKNTNVAIAIWLVAIALSLVAGNYIANNFASLIEDDRAERYLYAGATIEGFSHTGFRWDFLLFSALPIVIGWYVVVKRQIKDKFYSTLLNTYILANAVWVVFIYAAFSNRFAMLSWCIYPYVICYPFMKMKLFPAVQQTQYTCVLLWTQLIFTFYMTFK